MHLQLARREDYEEFQAKKMNSPARKTPQSDGTESAKSRSKSAANRRKSNGSTSSPESAADLRLGDARRTPGGFVSTGTRPPSAEKANPPAIEVEQAPASLPPFLQNQEYEQLINNDFLSDSWRPPPMPVELV